MGFAVTVAAIPTASKVSFLAAAGVTVTDQPDPDGAAPISAAEHGDHFVVWRNLRGAPLTTEPDWNAMSDGTPIHVLDVVDTAGAQILRGFRDGSVIYEVSFSDENAELLLVDGDLPVDVAEVQERLRSAHLARYPEDAEEDAVGLVAGYGSEIPARVFEKIVGFYHEDGPPEGLFALSGDLPQSRITETGIATDGARKPWWKVWG